MINIKLYTFKEKQPKHNSIITYIKLKGSFSSIQFDPLTQKVIYYWNEYNKNHDSTGTSICYDDEKDYGYELYYENETDDYFQKLELMLEDGELPSDDDLWCYEDDLLDILEGK